MFLEFILICFSFLPITLGKCSSKEKKGKRKTRKKVNEKSVVTGKKLIEKGEKKSTMKNVNTNVDSKQTCLVLKKEENNKGKANSPLPGNTGNANNVEKPFETNKDQKPILVVNNAAIDPDIRNSKIQKILQGETRDPNEYPTLADAGDGFDKNQTIEQDNIFTKQGSNH